MRILRLTCVALMVTALIGCHPSPKPSPAKQRATVSAPREPAAAPQALDNTGGCDARLQDISGLFLLYSLKNHRLPDSMDELRKLPGGDMSDFAKEHLGRPHHMKFTANPQRLASLADSSAR